MSKRAVLDLMSSQYNGSDDIKEYMTLLDNIDKQARLKGYQDELLDLTVKIKYTHYSF